MDSPDNALKFLARIQQKGSALFCMGNFARLQPRGARRKQRGTLLSFISHPDSDIEGYSIFIALNAAVLK